MAHAASWPPCARGCGKESSRTTPTPGPIGRRVQRHVTPPHSTPPCSTTDAAPHSPSEHAGGLTTIATRCLPLVAPAAPVSANGPVPTTPPAADPRRLCQARCPPLVCRTPDPGGEPPVVEVLRRCVLGRCSPPRCACRLPRRSPRVVATPGVRRLVPTSCSFPSCGTPYWRWGTRPVLLSFCGATVRQGLSGARQDERLLCNTCPAAVDERPQVHDARATGGTLRFCVGLCLCVLVLCSSSLWLACGVAARLFKVLYCTRLVDVIASLSRPYRLLLNSVGCFCLSSGNPPPWLRVGHCF